MEFAYLRSTLSTPGHRQNMVDKTFTLEPQPDGVIFDLEDAVPPELKETARAMAAEAVARPRRAGAAARFVRVNGTATGRLDGDIRAVVRPGLDAIVLPKVERPEDVIAADKLIASLEESRGIAADEVRILVSIESAIGLLRAYEIVSSSPRVLGVFLGAEDFSRDLGLPVKRAGLGQEALFARSTIVVAAAAARVFALDQGSMDFRDLDTLRTTARQGRDLGFTGAWCIHPAQIQIVNEVYSPSPEEVDLARRVVAAYEDAKAQGLGAVMMGGQFVEIPIVERAQRTLRLHERVTAGRN